MYLYTLIARGGSAISGICSDIIKGIMNSQFGTGKKQFREAKYFSWLNTRDYLGFETIKGPLNDFFV